MSASVAAAQDARDREDLEASAALLRDAQGLRAAPALRLDLVLLLVLAERSLYAANDVRAACELHAEVLHELGDDADELDRALGPLLEAAALLHATTDADGSAVAAVLDEALALAERAGEPRRTAVVLWTAADLATLDGRWRDMEGPLLRLARIGDPQDRREVRVWTGVMGTYGGWPMGRLLDWVEAELPGVRAPRARWSLSATRAAALAALGDPRAAAQLAELEQSDVEPTLDLGLTAAIAIVLAGRADAADYLRRLVDDMLATHDYTYASTYLPWLLLLRLEQLDGVPDDVEAEVERAASWTSPGDVLSTSLVAAVQAVVAARRGLPEAAGLARRAVEVVDRSDQIWQQADVRRWVAEALPPDEARQALTEALALYDTKQIRTWRDDLVERLGMLQP